jgi:hypothetical protein
VILAVSGRRVEGKLMTNDGAGKRHEGADRAPDARDRGEERSVQAICLRYRLLKRQGAGATCEDQQFDELQPEGCKGAVTTTVIRTMLSERIRAHCLF